MKKKIFFYSFMLIFLANISYGQVYQTETVYGRDVKRILVDSTLRIPKGLSTKTNDNIEDSVGLIALKDTTDGVYYFTGQRWKQLGGGGGGGGTLTGSDTISLSDRINLKVDSVTTSSDSATLYYWVNGSSYRIVDLAVSVTGGDTTIYNTVLDSTGNPYKRVIIAGPNNKLTGYEEFIYDSSTGIVRIQRLSGAPYSDPGLIVDGSINANGLKVFVRTDLYNEVYMQEVGTSGGSLSDSASVRPLGIDPATGKVYRLPYWPAGISQSQLDDSTAAIRADFPSGSGSVEYVVKGYGIQIDSAARVYTVNVDSLVIVNRDWFYDRIDSLVTTFSGGITQLTGDVTAGPGSGSQAATLATVNSNVGTFGSASKTVTTTVNGKGLTTAISQQDIAIAESQVTNLTTDLAGKEPVQSGTGYVKKSGTTASYQSNTQLTADVNTFTQTLSGAVPAPTTLNGYFLKDNGTWAAASGGTSGVNYVAADSAFVGSVSGVSSNGTDGGSTSPNYNILIGNLNGQGMGAGVENISLGHGAMQNANPSYGVGVGYQAMQNSTAYYGIGIGYRALLNAQANTGTTNDNFIAIGAQALATFTTNSGGALGGSNTAIGREALENLTTGSGNFAFGLRALESLTNGNDNVALGDLAGSSFVSGVRNVGIGKGALRGNTGNDNIAIGTNAGLHTAATGSNNIFIQSSNSTYTTRTSAANNIVMGTGGTALTSGFGNLILANGYGESTITSGGNNIALGDRPVVPSATASNQVVFATNAFNILLSDYNGASRRWLLAGDNSDPTTLTTSATLHITGTGGGLLIPALTSTQRNAVSTPASGLQVVNTTLQNTVNVYNGTAWVNTNQQLGNEAITANKTITATTGTHLHMVDATAGNITITLPTMAAGYVGVEYQFIRTDASANTVTVTRAGSNTINNAATSFTIAQFERAYVIGVNNSNTFTWHAGKFTNY